jgi:hypothetical protein
MWKIIIKGHIINIITYDLSKLQISYPKTKLDSLNLNLTCQELKISTRRTLAKQMKTLKSNVGCSFT